MRFIDPEAYRPPTRPAIGAFLQAVFVAIAIVVGLRAFWSIWTPKDTEALVLTVQYVAIVGVLVFVWWVVRRLRNRV